MDEIMAPFLDVRDLSIAFSSRAGDLSIVERSSFQLAKGEVLGLVGESGCGKSVTALSLMRLLPQTARVSNGSIRLGGTDLLSMSERAFNRIRGRRIGMIFQEPMSSLNPVQTVGWQIMEPLRVHLGLSRAQARERAIELLERVRVPAAASRLAAYPHELSGGLRQRVMIAIAISCEPELLIADEPTTALDVTIQAQMIDLLVELQKSSGMSVVIITHDLGVVADFANKVAVMYTGRIVETGPVGAFFDRPVHPYTQALIASLPDPENPDRKLSTIEGTVPRPLLLPPGCRFAPRCGFRRPVCETILPDLWDVGSDQAAACLKPFDYEIPDPHD
ncbi:MAG: ABC transporter ATP-binding protein [Hyphomicrobiales bacterium]|nr:ABC transporter ATP-binding protein [Hyphomicrobiales bacterium]